MVNTRTREAIKVFSTCPQSSGVEQASYLRHVADVARWSEHNGCEGILVYTDNSLVDPWLVSQVIIQNTEALCPLVAVQPVYMHPYSVANMVATLGYLYGRRVYLNMVAGGFKNDLAALNDATPHDSRYERLTEYTTVVKRLLDGGDPVSYSGRFYTVQRLRMMPPLPAALCPGIFVSGSSEAGLAAARAMGATPVIYPKPSAEYEGKPTSDAQNPGIRIGIIVRADEAEAWDIAHGRFPGDRQGRIIHQIAMQTSDSVWHKQLSQLAQEERSENPLYWLHPFENYKTFCPYLVGSYERVAEEIAKYIGAGFRTFILDIPPSEEELHHIGVVFERALEGIAS